VGSEFTYWKENKDCKVFRSFFKILNINTSDWHCKFGYWLLDVVSFFYRLHKLVPRFTAGKKGRNQERSTKALARYKFPVRERACGWRLPKEVHREKSSKLKKLKRKVIIYKQIALVLLARHSSTEPGFYLGYLRGRSFPSKMPSFSP